MRILMITAEYAPLAKVGGLADMTASLSRALAGRGHDVRVALPLYAEVDRREHRIHPVPDLGPMRVRVGKANKVGKVHEAESREGEPTVYLLENESLFGRGGIYLEEEKGPLSRSVPRLVFHSRAALQLPSFCGWKPDVIHGHDSQAALALVYLRQDGSVQIGPPAPASMLTIHNLAHQSLLPGPALELLGLPGAMGVYPGLLEYHGQLNLLKAGILAADRVTTVSPTYAREVVSDPKLGCGLDGVLRDIGDRFSGVLNGADLQFWNPATDPYLPAPFEVNDLSGKVRCRAELAASLGLVANGGPVIGLVGRLVEQKGWDLVLDGLDRMVGAGFSVAILGSGSERYRRALALASKQNRNQVAFVDGFDEGLAHRIIAGSDLFLMPSLFEPCGLTQMYALRYGTVPVVRATGGLADTVVDASLANGTGFVFDEFDSQSMLAALSRARLIWDDMVTWSDLVRRGMNLDFSWGNAATAYEEIYSQLAPVGASHE